MDENLPFHVRWILDRRGQDLVARLAAEGTCIPAGDAVRVLMACDPSPRKVATQWLCDSYLAGGFLWEDASAGVGSKAAETLRLFAAHRSKLPAAERNLSAHAGLASLYKAVKPLLAVPDADVPSGKALRRAERERALAESVVVHRSEDLVVAVPLTEDASRWWGRGTRWCTAAEKNCAFREYDRTGPLIVMILPGREPGQPVRKWQMHVDEDGAQFMDEDDSRIEEEDLEGNWDRVGGIMDWALARSGFALGLIPMARRTPGMCLEAVRRDGAALRHVPLCLMTPELCLEGVRQVRRNRALHAVPWRLRSYGLCLEAVTRRGEDIDCVPREIRARELCLAAAGQNHRALEHVPEDLLTSGFFAEAVRLNGMALKFVPDALRTSELFLEAVEQSGRALSAVPFALRSRKLCMAAVRTYGLALQDTPPEMLSQELCAEAVRQDGMALLWVPGELQTPGLCLEAVRLNPMALGYVPPEIFRSTDEFLVATESLWGKQGRQEARQWDESILDGIGKAIRAHALTEPMPGTAAGRP